MGEAHEVLLEATAFRFAALDFGRANKVPIILGELVRDFTGRDEVVAVGNAWGFVGGDGGCR